MIEKAKEYLGELGGALALSYTGLFLIDLSADSYKRLSSNGILDGCFAEDGNYSEAVARYVSQVVAAECREEAGRILASSYAADVLSMEMPVIETEFYTVSEYGRCWYRAAISMVSMSEGKPERVLLALRDVTAAKRTEEHNRQELQKSKEILQVLTTNTSEVVMVVDAGTKCVDFLSKNVEKLMGTTEPEILYTDDNLPYFKQLRVSKAIVQRIHKEWDYKTPYHIMYIPIDSPVTRERQWYSVHVYAVEINGYRKFLLIFHEVTEERRQSEALRLALEDAKQANEAKSNFLSNVSHDIRTPLNAIVGMTSLALRHLDERDRVEDCIKKIEVASGNLLRLLNGVLDIGKIENGKRSLNKTEFGIADMIEETVAIIQPQAEMKGVGFSVSCHNMIHTKIFSDYVQMEQVLCNILGNAIKYTKAGGKVEFEVSQVTSQTQGMVNCRFVVRDTGIGMKKEFLPNLFEVFQQERTSLTTSEEGFGLGMAITKSIVDLMSGTIEVESEYGVGTTFTVMLPAEIPGVKEEEKQGSRKGGEPSFRGLRFLLAEDNATNREIAVLLLGEMGAEVETAEDGAVAVQMFRDKESSYYDAILMDIQMPNKNGYEATKEIRTLEKKAGGHIPIVAMTANAFAEDVSQALSVGMDAHIAKPVDYDALAQIVAQLGAVHR